MRVIILLIVVLAAANIEAIFDIFGTCQTKLDSCFVVDGSGDICGGHESCLNWYIIRWFVREVTKSWKIGPDDTKVALVTFGNEPKVEWDLNGHTDGIELRTAIDHLEFPGGELSEPGLVGAIAGYVYTPAGGERTDVRKPAVLITNGAPYINPNDAEAASTVLKNNGIIVFVVCILEGGCTEEFARRLSSEPKEKGKNYFLVHDYLSLYAVKDALEKEMCG